MKLSDLSLDFQIQIVPQIIGGMSIGTDQNINFACHYSRFIDTEQSFDVTQASFRVKVEQIVKSNSKFENFIIKMYLKTIKVATRSNCQWCFDL